jgi:predicted HicB family RNase H-like nuclease
MKKEAANFDPSAFGIMIRRKNVEGHWYFSGSVAELPDVEVFEDSNEAAYEEVINVIRSLKVTADEQHRLFPKPQSPTDDYSGRVTLRIPKSLHKRSAEIANWEGVSLNQLFVTWIAEGVGQKTVMHSATPASATTVLATPDVGIENSNIFAPNQPSRPTFGGKEIKGNGTRKITPCPAQGID